MVTSKQSRLDQAFLEKQRRQLTRLRTQILAVRKDHESDRDSTIADASAQAREYEDEAQKLTTLELQGQLSGVDDQRLSNIERALQKLDDGTYGLSDGSGAPISIERLEAYPEALYTLEEQKSRESAR